MATIPGDSDTGSQVVQSAFAGRAPNSAIITARLAGDIDLDAARETIKSDLQPLKSDGYDLSVAQQSAMGTGSGLSIVVSGQDAAEIKAASDAIVLALGDMDGIDNIASDAVAEAPQVSVAVDPNMAMIDRLHHRPDRHRHPRCAGGSVHRLLCPR